MVAGSAGISSSSLPVRALVLPPVHPPCPVQRRQPQIYIYIYYDRKDVPAKPNARAEERERGRERER